MLPCFCWDTEPCAQQVWHFPFSHLHPTFLLFFSLLGVVRGSPVCSDSNPSHLICTFLVCRTLFFFKDAVESKTKREGTGLFENGVFSWMTSLCAVRSGYHHLLVVLPEQTVAIWSVPWSDRIQHCKSGANLTRVFILMGTGEVVILCLMDTPLPSIDVKIKGLLCWSPAYLCLSENTDLLQGSASPGQQQPAHWQAPIPRW